MKLPRGGGAKWSDTHQQRRQKHQQPIPTPPPLNHPPHRRLPRVYPQVDDVGLPQALRYRAVVVEPPVAAIAIVVIVIVRGRGLGLELGGQQRAVPDVHAAAPVADPVRQQAELAVAAVPLIEARARGHGAEAAQQRGGGVGGTEARLGALRELEEARHRGGWRQRGRAEEDGWVWRPAPAKAWTGAPRGARRDGLSHSLWSVLGRACRFGRDGVLSCVCVYIPGASVSRR